MARDLSNPLKDARIADTRESPRLAQRIAARLSGAREAMDFDGNLALQAGVVTEEYLALPATAGWLPHVQGGGNFYSSCDLVTLVREDGQEEEVFALIGPKKYDFPWKDLERQG